MLLNALIFQEVLSSADSRVHSLLRASRSKDPVSELVGHWDFIEREINYIPIFRVARVILEELSSGEVDDVLRGLCDRARGVVRNRAALKHDLMGRVYHRLLLDAKYLATYFTSVPAATLLAKLLFQRSRSSIAWEDPDQVAHLRIADLACGTGTLLMAAAEAVSDNHVRASAEDGSTPQLEELHRRLLEETIVGCDVLTTALHLTASTLALRASTVAFDHTNLHCMPLGGPNRSLGSIEFLERRTANTPMVLFREGAQVRGGLEEGDSFVELADLDFCIMNPPFARSVVGNLLFGSVPESDRAALQTRLGRMLRDHKAETSTTAGLGSIFVAVGDTALKPGGGLGLVLPKALLSGVAWTPTRTLLGRDYHIEYIISSHDPERLNFSENTELSETLVVARKRAPGDSDASTVGVNLWHNPRTVFEALACVRELEQEPPPLEKGRGALSLHLGTGKIGEAFTIASDALLPQSWGVYSAFAQTDLVRVAASLVRSQFTVPGRAGAVPVPLCALEELGEIGPDVRDIHDAFERTDTRTQYAAHWGNDSNEVTTMAREPNQYLSARATAAAGRGLRDADLMWSRAGRVMITARLRLNTYRITAARLPDSALGSGWWPFRLQIPDASPDTVELAERAVVLWLNSTPGLLLLLANRIDTQGAWTQFKKPMLEAMPVLDPRALSEDTLEALAASFDSVSSRNLEPFPLMQSDPVRQAIDEAISDALGLPDMAPLRMLLAQEPTLCLVPLS